MKKLYLVMILVGLSACASKPSNELEDISKDVLKSRMGVDIQVKPIPKEGK